MVRIPQACVWAVVGLTLLLIVRNVGAVTTDPYVSLDGQAYSGSGGGVQFPQTAWHGGSSSFGAQAWGASARPQKVHIGADGWFVDAWAANIMQDGGTAIDGVFRVRLTFSRHGEYLKVVGSGQYSFTGYLRAGSGTEGSWVGRLVTAPTYLASEFSGTDPRSGVPWHFWFISTGGDWVDVPSIEVDPEDGEIEPGDEIADPEPLPEIEDYKDLEEPLTDMSGAIKEQVPVVGQLRLDDVWGANAWSSIDALGGALMGSAWTDPGWIFWPILELWASPPEGSSLRDMSQVAYVYLNDLKGDMFTVIEMMHGVTIVVALWYLGHRIVTLIMSAMGAAPMEVKGDV